MREERKFDVVLEPSVVRARFSNALRSGNPQWLWPDTNPANWRDCLVSIENAVRSVLTGDHTNAFLEGNPHDISIASLTSGMGPLLGYWGKQGKLRADPSVQLVLDCHLAHNNERMAKLSAYAAQVIARLSDAGLHPIVLKGMHTAFTYFPTPGTRPVSDIDLWVQPKEFDSAANILQLLDYRYVDGSPFEQTWRLAGSPSLPRSLALVHTDDPWSIDLHRSLDRRYSPGASLIRVDRLVQNSARDAWSIAPGAVTLTGPTLVFYLAFHASTSLASLTILRLTELVFVIRRLEADNEMCWDEFMEICRRAEAPSCTFPAIRIVNLLAPGTVPDRVVSFLEDAAPIRVRKFIEPLTPATCQRVKRCSFQERVMWISGFRGWAREIWMSLFPKVPLANFLAIYHMRFWRIARGKISV